MAELLRFWSNLSNSIVTSSGTTDVMLSPGNIGYPGDLGINEHLTCNLQVANLMGINMQFLISGT